VSLTVQSVTTDLLITVRDHASNIAPIILLLILLQDHVYKPVPVATSESTPHGHASWAAQHLTSQIHSLDYVLANALSIPFIMANQILTLALTNALMVHMVTH